MDPKLKRNIFWKAIEAVVTIACSFIQLSYITHAYQPAIVGQYQLTLAWLFFISAFSSFAGIVMVATRELTNSPEVGRSSIFSTAMTLQAIVAAPLCVVAIYLFNRVPYFQTIGAPLSFGTATMLLATLLQLSQGLIVSKDRIGTVAVASIVGQLAATILVVFAALNGCSLSTLVMAWATYNVISGMIFFAKSRAWQATSIQLVNLALLKRLSVEILPVLVMVLATHLYVRIDVIMLDHYTNKETVAQYGAGYLFLDQLMTLSNFMMGALFPNFARSCSAHGHDFQALYHGIFRLFLKYLVPIALGIALFSRFLLSSLYGPAYATAWQSLSLLMLAAMFAWLNGPSGTIFISLKKQHVYMWATVISLTVNIVGNLILIPAVGAVGAALATVLTEASVCAFCLSWIYRQTGYLPWMKIQK